MATPRSSAHPLKYLLTVVVVTAAVLGLRFLITWAAEVFLYPIPILGGWLKSLEIIELSVLPLFAFLGFTLGAATHHLPAKTPLVLKSIALLIALPLVFFSSYWLRHYLWIGELTAQSDLTRDQITALANQAMTQQGSQPGFWGYYTTTTRMPILPATVSELQRMAEDEKWFRSELTRFSGIEPGVFSMVFDGAGWGIRIFYMLLAFLTGLIYFFKGLAKAEVTRLRQVAQGAAGPIKVPGKP